MSEVMIGAGLATGMFYHAPKGTALPTNINSTIASPWVNGGNVTSEGITLSISKDSDAMKNWANRTVRTIMTDHKETIKVPLMDTNEETLKIVLGASNVTNTNGTIKANLSSAEFPPTEAFLFLMKDGDKMMMIGCTEGQITELDDITFEPGDAIKWQPTIEALGDGWKLIYEEITGTV